MTKGAIRLTAMAERTGWNLLAGKIRTIGFICAMTPILVIVGILCVLAVILSSPITLIGIIKDKPNRR